MEEPLKSIERFDDVFKITGGRGLFQLLVYFYSVSMDAAGNAIVKYFIFDVANPGWYCPALNYTNGTVDLVDGYCVDGRPCDNFTFDDMYTSATTEWTLICDRNYITGLISSIFFAGLLCGSMLFSQLSDLFGRKMATLLSWSIAIVFQALTMFSPYWQVYAALRFVAGSAVGGIMSISSVILAEYVSPNWRSIISHVPGVQIGPLVMTGLCYGLRDWRWQRLAVGVWSTPFFLIACFFLPESARWLLQKGRFKEAEICIARMAKINRKSCPDFSILKKIAVRENSKRKNRQHYSFHDLFSTKTVAIQSLSLLFTWFSMAMITFMNDTQMSKLKGNVYLNVAISYLCILSTRWIFVFIMNFTGRRKCYSILSGLICCFMIIVVVLDYIVAHAIAKTVIIIAVRILEAGPWCIVMLFSVELYPTLMRNISVGAANVASRIGGMVAPQAALLAILHPSAPYVLLAVLALISSIVVYTNLPETLGRPLPEDLPITKNGKQDFECDYRAHEEEETKQLTLKKV